MKKICIDGYNSYVAKIFYDKSKKKNKIYKFRSDINNIEELKKFIIKKKISIYIRFAGLSRVNCDIYKQDCYLTNYIANKKLVDFFKKKKIKLIFISSSHVYSYSNKKIDENFLTKPNNNYGKLKLKSENYIKKNLQNFSILRVFNIYGKNQPKGYFIPDIKKKIKDNISIKINNSYRDFINVKEVVRFINFLIKKDLKGIYNIGSGKSYKLKDIIKMISNKMKIKSNLLLTNKTDKLICNNTLIKENGFNIKNEKNINL